MLTNKISSFASRISIAATTVFLVLFLAVHILKPEIDPSWRFISELAIGSYGWIMVLAFFALALGYTGLIAALWKYLRITGKIGLGFLIAGSLGLILAGIFTTQPINTIPEELSVSSKLHGLGAILGTNGVFIGSLIVTITLIFNKDWLASRWLILLAFIFNSIIYVWFLMIMPDDGKFGPNVAIGLPNRLLMVSYCLWLLVTAWYAFKLSSSNKVSG